MTNGDMLRQKIKECGFKMVYVASQCGLTYNGFLKKLNNETEFKVSEMMTLRKMLNLSSKEADAIFFCKDCR